eukprot:2526612-Amphidinium_carterae.1
MMRWVTGAVERSLAAAACVEMECTIEPTAVAVLTFPEAANEEQPPDGEQVSEACTSQPLQVEFAYGAGQHRERAVGRMSIQAGSAVSFTCLCEEVRVDNKDQVDAEDDQEQESAVAAQTAAIEAKGSVDSLAHESTDAGDEPQGGNGLDDEDTEQESDLQPVVVENRDYAPITLSFYAGATHLGHLFDNPLATVTLDPAERKPVIVPLPAPTAPVEETLTEVEPSAPPPAAEQPAPAGT